jgi:pimeloyl-ACP methyl ester carboxylesterase
MRHDPFYQVVLVSPYKSIKSLLRSHGGCLLAAIVKDYFNSASKIGQIKSPLLIIHGDRDAAVPVSHG